MKYNYPSSVPEAANILDIAMPNWAKKINKTNLDIRFADRCILGQLFVEEYDEGMRVLFDIECASVEMLRDSVFGITTNINEWLKEIDSRV